MFLHLCYHPVHSPSSKQKTITHILSFSSSPLAERLLDLFNSLHRHRSAHHSQTMNYKREVVIVQGSSRPASIYSTASRTTTNTYTTYGSSASSSTSYYPSTTSSSTMSSSSGSGSGRSGETNYYYDNSYRNGSADGYLVNVKSSRDRYGNPVDTINHREKYSDPAEDRSKGYMKVSDGRRDRTYHR
jgi:hypothetical protein